MQLWSIEGNSQRLDGGSMFGNAPRAVWEKWMPADDRHRILLACRALLARPLNGKTVLFETGIGAFFEPRLRDRYGVQESSHVLLHSLRAAGFSDADIDVVVLSHLHFDHAGGLLAAWEDGQPLRLLFPNATFVISECAWERACAPHERDRASFISGLQEMLAATGRVELVDGQQTPVLGSTVRFHFSEGHTPGLMLSEIVGPHDHGGVLFASDLIPGRPWVHLPITMGYDRAPEQLIDEKRELLADLRARGVHLFFTHDPECALAQVVMENGRYSTTHEVRELHARHWARVPELA